jgi:23S rRNA (uracil-5-)-methyltransferase RumA
MSRSRKAHNNVDVSSKRVQIESLSHDGRGVARIDGKAVFIEGALVGEEVTFRYHRRHSRYDEGWVEDILHPSPDRVAPRCPFFGVCAGCSLQHLDVDAQIRAKQWVLLDNLRHIGKLEPETVLPPLTGPAWGYRRKARLGVKYVINKGRVLVGFHEKGKSYVADLRHCDILHPAVGPLLADLACLIGTLKAFERIPQIEVAVGDQVAALVFRTLVDLDSTDCERLSIFGVEHGLNIYLQPQRPDSLVPLVQASTPLSYSLPDYGVELFFEPTDFIQVNAELNRKMIDLALALLAPQRNERVLDLFCGIGNFSLPLARRAGEVVGVEGDPALVARARDNAACNGIDNAAFHSADLSIEAFDAPWSEQPVDKILLDPPRIGAKAVMALPGRLGATRIVYISCNPGTFARDAGILVNTHGYCLSRVGAIDMFPHTAHVESIAVFEKAA